jgi:hypothetical protein
MFEFLMTVIPELLVKSRRPMDAGARQAREKIRRRGKLFFILLWTCGMGGTMFAFNVCWARFFEHQDLNSLTMSLEAAAWFQACLFIAVVDWNLNERRYRNTKQSDMIASK